MSSPVRPGFEDKLCTASTHRGTPCTQRAVEGSVVCRFHGGGTPIAKNRIKQKLLAACDEAVDALHTAMQLSDWPQVVRAALGILDRAGFGPSQTLKVEAPETDMMKLTDDELKARTEQVLRLIEQRKAKGTVTPTNDDTTSETPGSSGLVH